MEQHDRLAERVAQEQEDVLVTMQLVRGDAVLEEHLFDRLVDLLVEGLFIDLRQEHLDGELTRAEYLSELGSLAERCHRAGLLPLPSRTT